MYRSLLAVLVCMTVAHASAQRVVLMEKFTATILSPALTYSFDSLVRENLQKVDVIKYYNSIGPSDTLSSYNNWTVSQRKNYYNVTVVPRVYINGTFGPIALQDVTQSLIDSIYALPAIASVNIPILDTIGGVAKFDVEVHALQALPNHYLRVGVVQDSITFPTPPGANGQTTFMWTMRELLPNLPSTKSAMPSGSSYTESHSFDLDPDIPFDEYSLVVFVQNKQTKEVLTSFNMPLEDIYQKCSITKQELCLATIDPAGLHNLITWEEDQTGAFEDYILLRETTSTGVFAEIAVISNDSLSQFIDINSNPSQQSYRYAIQAIDTCGDTTEMSGVHRTLHLQVAEATSGDHNLSWNNYEGNFTATTYRVYADTGNGPFLLDSISAAQTSYTVLNPSPTYTTYQIEVVHPSGCQPTAIRAETIYSSRSNPFSIGTPSGVEKSNGFTFRVAPNPVNTGNTISVTCSSVISEYVLFDVYGRVVSRETTTHNSTIEIPTSNLNPGAYFLCLYSGDSKDYQQVIIE